MSNFLEIINKPIPVLIDFYADWCGPCQVMSPVLKDVKSELGDKVAIIKINVDKNQALAQKFQVRGVPTFMIFKNGKSLWRQSGVLNKENLVEVLTQFA
jgi:thioredoxin 1